MGTEKVVSHEVEEHESSKELRESGLLEWLEFVTMFGVETLNGAVV
jgi:hypothetical protein